LLREIMPLLGFSALQADLDYRKPMVPVAAAGGADATVLEALRIALDRGWVAPIVCGQETAIRRVAGEVGVSLDGFAIVEADGENVGRAAVAEVRSGRAMILMKGQIPTPNLMHAILDAEHGLRSGRVVAQVVLMEIVRDARRFLLADTGVMVRPRLPRKLEILLEAVEVARALGEPTPRVAMMAASEKVIDGMPETFDAAELQTRSRHGEFPGLSIQGPLSFDLAYAPAAAGKKGIAGEVVGAADVMIFPDLSSANLTVKAIMYTADCRFGGVLQGTSRPVAFMSRADDVPTRLNSLALAERLVSRR
jgi:phosphate butyryltransferase